MIVEQRDYHVFTGKLERAREAVRDRGDRAAAELPRQPARRRSRPTSARSRRTRRIWGYDNFAEREERRAKLQADDAWKAFLAKIQPLIHTQQNRILVPTSFSPVR